MEVLLASSVLLAVFARWSKLIKQILLTGATFLTGTLLAVFGQIYQTGADAYDLFLGWTLFTVLWAIAARFAPLWLTFIGLLCTTIWLYNIQISTHGSWKMVLLANAVTWVCASAAAIAEWMSAKGNLNKQNHWFVDILSLATIIHTSFLLMSAISDTDSLAATTFWGEKNVMASLISTILVFSAGLWWGWKKRNLFYLAAIPFAVLMILLCAFICHSNLKDANLFFLSGMMVITGTTLLIYIILQLKKKWYGTEA